MTAERTAPPAVGGVDDNASWWREFYDDLLADVVLVRVDGGERGLRFLVAALGIVPGQRVLDLADRRVTRKSRVGLYHPHELGALFARAGFVDLRFHGSIAGEPLGPDSPRCLVLGRRPEEDSR